MSNNCSSVVRERKILSLIVWQWFTSWLSWHGNKWILSKIPTIFLSWFSLLTFSYPWIVDEYHQNSYWNFSWLWYPTIKHWDFLNQTKIEWEWKLIPQLNSNKATSQKQSYWTYSRLESKCFKKRRKKTYILLKKAHQWEIPEIWHWWNIPIAWFDWNRSNNDQNFSKALTRIVFG